jgi:hypothetical protein
MVQAATSDGLQQPYYFNADDPGFKYLNPQAQEAAKTVGYGIRSQTPMYYDGVWAYDGQVTWYPNWMAYRAAEMNHIQKDVVIGPYMQKAKTGVDNDWYTLKLGE